MLNYEYLRRPSTSDWTRTSIILESMFDISREYLQNKIVCAEAGPLSLIKFLGCAQVALIARNFSDPTILVSRLFGKVFTRVLELLLHYGNASVLKREFHIRHELSTGSSWWNCKYTWSILFNRVRMQNVMPSCLQPQQAFTSQKYLTEAKQCFTNTSSRKASCYPCYRH